MVASTSAAAIESQAIGLVAPLAAEIRQVFGCGTWSTAGQAGSYRIVLVDVSERAGTEVYVQRVLDPGGLSSAPARILETIPIRELNDDHAQYSVSSARCLRDDARGTVELRATFEHDEGDVQRRIRIVLGPAGAYRLVDEVLRPRRR